MSTITILILGLTSLLVVYIATGSIYFHMNWYKNGEFIHKDIGQYSIVEYTFNSRKKTLSWITKYVHIRKLKYDVRINDKIVNVDYSTLLELSEEDSYIRSKFYDFRTLIFLQNYLRLLRFVEEYQSRFSYRYYFILLYGIAPFLIKKKSFPIIHPAYFYWGDINSVVVKWLKAVRIYNKDYLTENEFLHEIIEFLIFNHLKEIVDEVDKALFLETKYFSNENHNSLRSKFEIESANKIEGDMYAFISKFRDENHHFRRESFTRFFLK